MLSFSHQSVTYHTRVWWAYGHTNGCELAYFEVILHGVCVIAVCEGERRSFERRDSRRDVAGQSERFNGVVVKDLGHA